MPGKRGAQADAFLGMASGAPGEPATASRAPPTVSGTASGAAGATSAPPAAAGIPGKTSDAGPSYAPIRGGREDGVQSMISALAGSGSLPPEALPLAAGAGTLAQRPPGATASLNPPPMGGVRIPEAGPPAAATPGGLGGATASLNPPPMGAAAGPRPAPPQGAPGGLTWPAPGQTSIPT